MILFVHFFLFDKESLQQQLERRLHATEKERDAVKQRLQNESWKPHRTLSVLTLFGALCSVWNMALNSNNIFKCVFKVSQFIFLHKQCILDEWLCAAAQDRRS